MHPQLRMIVEEFESARERLRRMATSSRAERWTIRPAEGSWSAAECIAHLNLTSTDYLRIIDQALQRAREAGGGPPKRLRRDLMGWLIWKASGPTGRMKAKTAVRFVPGAAQPLDDLIREFDRLQDEQIRRVQAADGLAIQEVKVRSPFNEKVSYSLYSALTILSAHQHRHLDQASRALTTTSGP